jgi:uncharacterized protein YbcI
MILLTGVITMKKKSRGEYEDAFTKAIIKFEREHLGRGPKDARTYLIGDMILVRLSGMLTSAESVLAQEREGAELIKETRRQLLESSRPIIRQIVQDILDRDLISLHTDMSIKTGERVIILIVDGNLDELFD